MDNNSPGPSNNVNPENKIGKNNAGGPLSDIDLFKEICGIDEPTASALLRESGGNLEAAIHQFFFTRDNPEVLQNQDNEVQAANGDRAQNNQQTNVNPAAREQQDVLADPIIMREQQQAYEQALAIDKQKTEQPKMDKQPAQTETDKVNNRKALLARKRGEVAAQIGKTTAETTNGTGGGGTLAEEKREDLVRIRLFFPRSDSAVERKFPQSDSLERLFDAAFIHPDCPDNFSLFTNFPVKQLNCAPDWYRSEFRPAAAAADSVMEKIADSVVGTFAGAGLVKSANVVVRDNDEILLSTDILMDTFPFFDHPQLGLKMALISPRFDFFVDAYFEANELTIWEHIELFKDNFAEVPKLRIIDYHGVGEGFPLPDCPLPNKFRFKNLHISYIDHSVLTFLHTNREIWQKMGTNIGIRIYGEDPQPIWNAFVREYWPIFAPNIRRLDFPDGDHLDKFRHDISPTILSDLNINSIFSGDLLPDAIGDVDEPDETAGQLLSKWLHTPAKNGQPNELRCVDNAQKEFEWGINFREKFARATTSVSYKIQFKLFELLEPFELVNERTKEKLTLTKPSEDEWDKRWIMKRCQIGETATVKWEIENSDALNTVFFWI